MNKTITSKEEILSVGKEIILDSGIGHLNIRNVAHKCNISIGTVYNYFPSKSDLVVATIESVWREIMHDSKGCMSKIRFTDSVSGLFSSVQKGCQKYPAFFSVHSMSTAAGDKPKGREAMERYFSHIRHQLLESLNQDPDVRADAFSDTFTREDFVDFVFSNVITLLAKEQASCQLLLEVIHRTIYQ